MYRDKTAARIILILFVVHVAVAAPVIVRQRSQGVDEVMTPAWEKRGNSGDTPQDLYPVPQMHNDLPTTSGISPSQDPSPEPGTPQLYNDLTPTSEAPSSQDDTSPAQGDLPYHDDPPTGSKDPQLQSDPPSASGVHSDSPLTSETLPVHNDLPSGSGEFEHVWRWLNDAPPGEVWLHVDSEVPSWSDSAPSWLFESEAQPLPPVANQVFSDEMKHKLKVLAGFGAAAGLSVYNVYKLIKGHYHGAYVSAFVPPSPADTLTESQIF